jgi:hypothetical protein
MRVKRLTTWLVLGIAVAFAYGARRRRGAPLRRAVPAGARGTPAEIDPSVLGRVDEVGEQFVEAIAGWNLEAELGAEANPSLGLELPDDGEAQGIGESWLEHLEARAAELGPEPEHALDVTDDAEPHAGRHPKKMTGDTPVADHGSGGPRGL